MFQCYKRGSWTWVYSTSLWGKFVGVGQQQILFYLTQIHPDLIKNSFQECNDVAKDIPYLEPAEECEEIFYDDCVKVMMWLFEKI